MAMLMNNTECSIADFFNFYKFFNLWIKTENTAMTAVFSLWAIVRSVGLAEVAAEREA